MKCFLISMFTKQFNQVPASQQAGLALEDQR